MNNYTSLKDKENQELYQKIIRFLSSRDYLLVGGTLSTDGVLYVNIEAHNGAQLPGDFGKRLKNHLGVSGLVLNSRIID